MKIIKPVAILIFSCFTLATYAQVHSEFSDAIDALIEKSITEQTPGGVVGVIKDGQFIHKKAYGLANLEYDIPMATNTIFRIASTSKQFTAACMFLLEQQAKLSLTDDIRMYLPDFPFYGDTIQVRHLIHHTSGLRDYTGLMYLWGVGDDFQYSPNDLYQLIKKQKNLDFKPGTKFSYSNSGYFLLSKIVASITGQSLAEYAKSQFFEPLGMTNTHFHDNHNEVVKNRAYGYQPVDSTYEISMSNNDIVGDGGIFTTLDDLLKWDNLFYNPVVGGNDLIKKMTTPGLLNDGSSHAYAGGLYMRNYRGIEKVTHTGWYAGFKSSMARYPEHKISIVILSNGGPIRPPILTNQIANIVLEEYLEPLPSRKKRAPQPQQPAKEAKNITDAFMKQMTGRFYSHELMIGYTFYEQDGKLLCRFGNNQTYELFYSPDGQLMIDDYIIVHPESAGTQGQIDSFSIEIGDSQGIGFQRVMERDETNSKE